MVSGIEALVIDENTRPVIVGERTNVLGSRKFKRLVAEGKWEEAAEIGRLQVRRGAHMLDVCLQDPDRNEIADLTAFLEIEVKKVKVPLMIDSTDAAAHRSGAQARAGQVDHQLGQPRGRRRKFQRVVPARAPLRRGAGGRLYRRRQAAGAGDSRASASSRSPSARTRSLTERYGIAPEDIIFDPLVFPGRHRRPQLYRRRGRDHRGYRAHQGRAAALQDRARHLQCLLRPARGGREVLNSVLLYHCVQAGLDLAIVNSEKLERYHSVPEEERRLAEDLIWWRGDDPIAAFAGYFRERKAKPNVEQRRSLPLDERLALYIIEGTKDGLIEDLDEALGARRPLEIINGPLMAGMDEVGRLFNNNEMIVAEVLQSAEAMKAAVAHLEPLMEKADSASARHDRAGHREGRRARHRQEPGRDHPEQQRLSRSINLGIKVPPEELIKALQRASARRHRTLRAAGEDRRRRWWRRRRT